MKFDKAGRGIIFDIGEITFGNFYAHSGTDGQSRANRENFCSETIPSLLTSQQSSGCFGGDFNMIIDKQDATIILASKLSPSFKRLIQTFKWTDSYRKLHPKTEQFSRYYGGTRGEGKLELIAATTMEI